jgi:hypothetical protein
MERYKNIIKLHTISKILSYNLTLLMKDFSSHNTIPPHKGIGLKVVTVISNEHNL